MGAAFATSGVTTLIRLSASSFQAARLELPEPVSEPSSKSFDKSFDMAGLPTVDVGVSLTN